MPWYARSSTPLILSLSKDRLKLHQTVTLEIRSSRAHPVARIDIAGSAHSGSLYLLTVDFYSAELPVADSGVSASIYVPDHDQVFGLKRNRPFLLVLISGFQTLQLSVNTLRSEI